MRGNPSILAEITHTRCGEISFYRRSLLSPGVRKSFYSGRVHTHQVQRVSSERKGLPFTRCEEILLFWKSSPTPCAEGSLWKEKDFLSSDVRGTFYSGRVPHNRCGEISFYRKELPFTRCEEILVFWKNSPHQVWRDLFLQKRTSFHQVWGNPCILEEFPTPGVWVSLWKERTSFHQVWGDPSILEEFTHTMCRGISLERRRLPFTMCEDVLIFWQSSPHQVWRDLFGKKRISSHMV